MKPQPIANPTESRRAAPDAVAVHAAIARHQIVRSHLRRGAALAALVCLSACVSPWPRGRYAQVVLDRPLPVSEADRQTECAWIRYEMGRQQEIVTQRAIFAEGREALMNRVNYEQNLMVLESRARAARCNE